MTQSDSVKIVGGTSWAWSPPPGWWLSCLGPGDTDTSNFLTQTGAACTLTVQGFGRPCRQEQESNVEGQQQLHDRATDYPRQLSANLRSVVCRELCKSDRTYRSPIPSPRARPARRSGRWSHPPAKRPAMVSTPD